jgi:hypothetical protein
MGKLSAMKDIRMVRIFLWSAAKSETKQGSYHAERLASLFRGAAVKNFMEFLYNIWRFVGFLVELKELRGCDPQYSGYRSCHPKRWPLLASLDLPEIVGIDAGTLCHDLPGKL